MVWKQNIYYFHIAVLSAKLQLRDTEIKLILLNILRIMI
jgi:hypothetical protein